MDWAGLNNNWAPGEPNDNRDRTYSEEDKLEIFKIYHHSFGLNDTPARKGYKSFVCKVPCLQLDMIKRTVSNQGHVKF